VRHIIVIIGLLWWYDTGASHGGCVRCTFGWGSFPCRNTQTVGLLIGVFHCSLVASMINTCVAVICLNHKVW